MTGWTRVKGKMRVDRAVLLLNVAPHEFESKITLSIG